MVPQRPAGPWAQRRHDVIVAAGRGRFETGRGLPRRRGRLRMQGRQPCWTSCYIDNSSRRKYWFFFFERIDWKNVKIIDWLPIGYEYIPDSESASITAGPSVGTWEDLTGPSGSEDDLLSDKPVAKKLTKKSKFQPQESKDDELVKDSGTAPRFVVSLPEQVQVKDGNTAR